MILQARSASRSHEIRTPDLRPVSAIGQLRAWHQSRPDPEDPVASFLWIDAGTDTGADLFVIGNNITYVAGNKWKFAPRSAYFGAAS